MNFLSQGLVIVGGERKVNTKWNWRTSCTSIMERNLW